MKITILQGAFLPVPPTLGGAVEKMWFALGKEFARKGHEVVQISRVYKDTPIQESIDGVLHKRIPGYDTPSSGLYLKWLDLWYTLKAKSVIPKDSDIIITNTFWAPILLPVSLRKKCLVDVARMPKGQMRLYRSSRLRANSTPVEKAIQQELVDDERDRVVMIPNPLPFVNPPNVDLKAKKPILLYAGRVHPEKGLELLIKAFKSLGTQWKLQIVGPAEIKAGGGGTDYLNSLKKLAVGLNVEFTGPEYDMARLNHYYAEASIFVYPSIAEMGETFGLAPLEAMAWGCVPIVSNLSCFQDFIEHNRNGLIFDHRKSNAVELLASAIESCLQNENSLISLAREALGVQQSHSMTFIATQFLDEFTTMVNRNNISTK